jgi:hypothetical protein
MEKVYLLSPVVTKKPIFSRANGQYSSTPNKTVRTRDPCSKTGSSKTPNKTSGLTMFRNPTIRGIAPDKIIVPQEQMKKTAVPGTAQYMPEMKEQKRLAAEQKRLEAEQKRIEEEE